MAAARKQPEVLERHGAGFARACVALAASLALLQVTDPLEEAQRAKPSDKLFVQCPELVNLVKEVGVR